MPSCPQFRMLLTEFNALFSPVSPKMWLFADRRTEKFVEEERARLARLLVAHPDDCEICNGVSRRAVV